MLFVLKAFVVMLESKKSLRYPVLSILLVLSPLLRAQSSTGVGVIPVFDIDAATARLSEEVSLQGYLMAFEDTLGTIDIEEVITDEYSDHFHHEDIGRPLTQNQAGRIWSRLLVKNQTESTIKFYIAVRSLYTAGDTVIVYRQSEKGYTQVGMVGWMVRIEDRPDDLMRIMLPPRWPEVVPLTLEAGETGVYYFSFTKDGQWPFITPRAWYYSPPVAEMYRSQVIRSWMFDWFYLGTIVLMMIYAFALYVIFRERAYLWLIFAQLVNCLFFVDVSTLGFYLWYSDAPFIYKNANIVLGELFAFGQLMFVSAYLELNKNTPRLFKTAFWVLVIGILFQHGLAVFDIRELGRVIINIAAITVSILIFIAISYLAFIRRERQAKIMFIAEFAVLVSAVVMSLIFTTVITLPVRGENIFQLGLLLQTLIWTVAIVDRILRLRNERDKAQRQELTLAVENAHLIREQNTLLEQKVEERTQELKEAHRHLVQQEKLASLGQLTAGIAHEIKNPLNFINNFAALNRELFEEAEQTQDPQERAALVGDIKSNLDKIEQHGQRADRIVKSMLEHSRDSTGEKQEVDLNVLCEEYLNLSYHGMRASNRDFHCEITMDPDPSLPQVLVAGQDIARVLLNLLNNAFYAVYKKQKTSGTDYRPAVSVVTRKEGSNAVVRVRDNGTGIPEHIRYKIFDPFFTTKPTGEGTGLGLSLSHDIIAAHHGTMQLTSEGGYTEFTVTLPLP